ncbi:MAG TPA: ATP-binding protein [Planctomycetota bacterium]|nr:ATP-binding protein [Planctomycetota bacterium]
MPLALKRLRNFVLLPKEISKFETDYLRRVNRLTMQFFWLHVPVFALIAWANDTGPLFALALTFLVASGPWVAYRYLANPRTVTLVYGFTAMLMGGLLVHFGQGPVQIEMHFYFFALLAMLALYGNPLSILVAAVTVAVHHLLLWLILPASVFNYDAPWWVVAVHAAFVVLESVATIYIARSFFDNVIGLEKIVQQRTTELDDRNRAMRLVLDNVDEGLLTIDREGRLQPEYSSTVERWFGAPSPHETVIEYFARVDAGFADDFALAWEQCLEDLLPLELALAQAPTKLGSNGRHYGLTYRPIFDGPQSLAGLLIVIADRTAELERQRLEVEQKETMVALDRILADKSGFLEFLSEADDLLVTVSSFAPLSVTVHRRALHTLKGNCMTFGIQSVADICHRLETAVLDEHRGPTAAEIEELAGAWSRLKSRLAALLGEQARRSIEIEPDEFLEVLSAALRGIPQRELVGRIAELRLERTSLRLRRIADQAQRIAKRLNKPDVEVVIEDGGLRLDAERWAPFWSSFVHVVRNSLDHGVESADERKSCGKQGAGRVCITTAIEGEEFVVTIEDDGRGVPWEKLREHVRATGLPCDTREDLSEALFVDGISTAEQVTEFSGRGVGLAAVRAACVDRGGWIEVQSEPGLGARFSFHFPVADMAQAPEEFVRSQGERSDGSLAA